MKRRRQSALGRIGFAMPSWRGAIVVAASILGACASGPPAPVVELSGSNGDSANRTTPAPAERPAPVSGNYRVVRGDTLYAIAFRHGLDYRDVAAWNKIAPPYRIYVGQDLRLDAGPSGPPRQAPATTGTTAAVAPRAPLAATPAPVTPGMFEDVNASPPAVAAAPKAAPVLAAQAGEETVASKPAPPGSPQPGPSASEAAPKTAPAEASPPPAHVTDDSVANNNGVAWRWPGRGSLIGTYVAGDQTRQGIDIAGKSGDLVLAAADGEVVYSGNGLLGYGELIIVKHNANFLSAYGHNRKRLVQEGDRVKGGQQIAEMGSSASARDELHFEIRKNGKPVNPIDYLPAR